MPVRLEGEGPQNERLYRALRAAISDGRLGPGARLPSTRRLASELGLSRTVVVAAFARLLGEGYVDGRLGSGTYVAARPVETSPRRRVPDAGAERPRHQEREAARERQRARLGGDELHIRLSEPARGLRMTSAASRSTRTSWPSNRSRYIGQWAIVGDSWWRDELESHLRI